MHIEFKRIILHNFMSFGDADLRFTDDGFIRVSGMNENTRDNAGSNGSGKSSLWEAIIWVLTGDTIRGTKQIVNMYGEDGTFVDVEFYVDDTRYQIIRSKDHKVRKTNIQILINGQDVSGKGIRDSEKLLQQYLPDLTASLLGSVIILGQGLPQKFTNNTPSGRKEVLEKLSKSDFMIEDLKTRVAARKSELTTESRNYEDSVVSATAKKDHILKDISYHTECLRHLDCDSLLSQVESCRADVDSWNTKQTSLREHVDHLDKAITRSNELLLEYASQQTQEMDQVAEKYRAMISEELNTVSTNEALLRSKKQELIKLQSITDVCPTCGQKLPDVHKPDTTALVSEITNLDAVCNVHRNRLNELQNNQTNEGRQIKDEYLDRTKAVNAMLSADKQESAAIKKELRDAEIAFQNSTNKLHELESLLAQLDVTIKTHEEIISKNTNDLTVIDEDILYNNKQKDLTQSHLEVINKFDTALKRDFRGYLLSTVIEYIERRAKYYSNMIFETSDVSFQLDGNNIDISYTNKSYENLSGGERQKIDLIIQFSIRDMLSTHLGFTSNILVLDEVFDGLDSKGCTKVIDMISTLTDVRNVFIVTHRKDLSIPSDKEILIVKSSAGISEIK